MATPFTAIAEGLDYVWQRLGDLGDWILGGLSDLGTSIISALESLGTSIVDGVSFLFIPSDGFIEQRYGQLYSDFNSKVPFVAQIGVLINDIINRLESASDTPPTFDLSIPQWGFEGTIIDFSFYAQYRLFVHGLIIATSWFMFLWRLFKRLPSIFVLPS